MRQKLALSISVLAVTGLGIWAWLTWRRPVDAGILAASQPTGSTNEARRGASPATTAGWVEALKKSSSRNSSLQILGEFRAQLGSLTPDEASGAIRTLLDSKTDVPTHLGFTVGSGGYLKESPSLRVFLRT